MSTIEKSKEDAWNLNELMDHLIKLIESDDKRFSFEFCAGIHENKETVISCSIEQAIHDLAVRFLHNNPGMKIEIVKAESV